MTRFVSLSVKNGWIDTSAKKSRHLFSKNGTQLLSHQPISSQGVIAAQQLLTCNVAKKSDRYYARASMSI